MTEKTKKKIIFVFEMNYFIIQVRFHSISHTHIIRGGTLFKNCDISIIYTIHPTKIIIHTAGCYEIYYKS
jgi:hypothetical protein